MKDCRDCGQPYYPLPSQIKKWDWQCAPCRRIEWKKTAARRKAQGKTLSGGRVAPEKYKAWSAEYRQKPDNKARAAANQRKYRKDPTKRQRYEARWSVNRAIASGRLIRKPCESCGTEKSQAHHHDYSKPLDVKWLCRPCHDKEHVKAEGR